MCSIIGAIIHFPTPLRDPAPVNTTLNSMLTTAQSRGRDGRGYHLIYDYGMSRHKDTKRLENIDFDYKIVERPYRSMTFLANMRAEPTTEYVKDKSADDQQPYYLNGWHIVHNGTIANDKQLRTNKIDTPIDSASIVEQLAETTKASCIEFAPQNQEQAFNIFCDTIRKLKGSFAILAAHSSFPGVIFTAANYRPIWTSQVDGNTYFSSTREMPGVPEMLEPYTMHMFCATLSGTTYNRKMWLPSQFRTNRKALVVCSGGLDSVVAACEMQRRSFDIHLIHFRYGSRAENPEVDAIQRVADHLKVGLTVFPLPVYRPGDSPLLDASAKVAGGEEGAEFAHEWVPARNLLLLSVATAFAESNGYDTIVLGNNLEEAGAYPDNEPEFVAKFNDLLPFAVGDGKRIRVVMPVGNMMKHEIVKLGLQLGAPLHLTWSCYRAGRIHCGTCGPCYMNNAEEVIQYANNF